MNTPINTTCCSPLELAGRIFPVWQPEDVINLEGIAHGTTNGLDSETLPGHINVGDSLTAGR